MLKDEDIKLPSLSRGSLRDTKGYIGFTAEQAQEFAREAVRMNFPMPAPGLCYSGSGNIPGFGGICIHAESGEMVEAAWLRLQGPAAPAPQPRPFDLEAAKAGAPVVTRDGTPARFVGHIPEASETHRVVAMIQGNAYPSYFHENGAYGVRAAGDAADLFMAPKPKRTVYATLWDDNRGGFSNARHYETEAEAKAIASFDCGARVVAVAVPIEIDA